MLNKLYGNHCMSCTEKGKSSSIYKLFVKNVKLPNLQNFLFTVYEICCIGKKIAAL